MQESTLVAKTDRPRAEGAERRLRRVFDQRISVVVATLNRPAAIAALMESLQASSSAPDEIIIVDQSADAATAELLTAYPRLGWRLVYIHDRGIRGASAARNRGIELATGDIIVFLDDDVILEPPFLEELVAVLENHPDCSGVSGVITNYNRPGLGQRLRDWLFYWGPFVDDRQGYYFRADRLRGRGPFRVTRAGSGLLAVRKALLESIRFRVLSGGYELGEDVDFSFQLAERGPLLLTPDARLVHVRAPGTRALRPLFLQEIDSWSALFHARLRATPAYWIPYAVLICCLTMQGAWQLMRARDGRWVRDLRTALKGALWPPAKHQS